jgi:hypothetical protein
LHLNFKTDKTAATVLFYHRLVEADRNERRSELAKRRRTEFMFFLIDGFVGRGGMCKLWGNCCKMKEEGGKIERGT